MPASRAPKVRNIGGMLNPVNVQPPQPVQPAQPPAAPQIGNALGANQPAPTAVPQLNKQPAIKPAATPTETPTGGIQNLQAQLMDPKQLAAQIQTLNSRAGDSNNRTQTSQLRRQAQSMQTEQDRIQKTLTVAAAKQQDVGFVGSAEAAYRANPNRQTAEAYNMQLFNLLDIPEIAGGPSRAQGPNARGRADPQAAEGLKLAQQATGFDVDAAYANIEQMIAAGHLTRDRGDSILQVLQGALLSGALVAAAGTAIAMGGSALMGALPEVGAGALTPEALALTGEGALGGVSSTVAPNALMTANAASQSLVGSTLAAGGDLMVANAGAQSLVGAALADAGITAAGATTFVDTLKNLGKDAIDAVTKAADPNAAVTEKSLAEKVATALGVPQGVIDMAKDIAGTGISVGDVLGVVGTGMNAFGGQDPVAGSQTVANRDAALTSAANLADPAYVREQALAVRNDPNTQILLDDVRQQVTEQVRAEFLNTYGQHLSASGGFGGSQQRQLEQQMAADLTTRLARAENELVMKLLQQQLGTNVQGTQLGLGQDIGMQPSTTSNIGSLLQGIF